MPKRARVTYLPIIFFLGGAVCAVSQSQKQPTGSRPAPADSKAPTLLREMHHEVEGNRTEDLEYLTNRVSKSLPSSPGPPVVEKNYIDKYIFEKIRQDKIPQASLCSDTEFLRRVSLDLTGRLPTPEKIREFVQDKDPRKREKLVDAIMTVTPRAPSRSPRRPFLIAGLTSSPTSFASTPTTARAARSSTATSTTRSPSMSLTMSSCAASSPPRRGRITLARRPIS